MTRPGFQRRRAVSLAACACAFACGFACTAATAQFEEMANAAPAADHLFSGTQLYQHRTQSSWVAAYVAGVIDADEGAVRGHMPLAYCLPADGHLAQYTEVVIGYLSSHPQSRQEPASALVRDSLATAFACAPPR